MAKETVKTNEQPKEGLFTRAIRVLKENKIDTGIGHIACACDAAWATIVKKEIKEEVTYDDFCETCQEIWLDCEEGYGVTTLADKVAYYLNRTGELPDAYYDIYDEEAPEEDEDDED